LQYKYIPFESFLCQMTTLFIFICRLGRQGPNLFNCTLFIQISIKFSPNSLEDRVKLSYKKL
jgi:hypothetical protein